MLTIRGIQVDGRCEIGERGRLAHELLTTRTTTRLETRNKREHLDCSPEAKRNETRQLGHTWCNSGHPLLSSRGSCSTGNSSILLSSFLLTLLLVLLPFGIHATPWTLNRVQLGRSWHTGQGDGLYESKT